MGEIFERMAPVQALPWTGERLTSETGGQVEIEHLHRYFVARTLCRGLDVLDVASGEGYGSALLAQTARSVVGVEISPEAVEHASAAYSRPNLRYLAGDAREIPLPSASVDVVVSFETIEHFFEHDKFLEEVRRVLRPGGFFLVSSPERDVYSPAGGTPNPHHVHELTRDEFDTLLRRHFAHVSLYGQRPLLGAALVPEKPSEGPSDGFWTFERRDGRLFEASPGLPRAIYLVALCSDVRRHDIQGSLYIETSAIEGIYSSGRAAQAEIATLTQRLLDEGDYAQRVQAELNRRDEQLAEHVSTSTAQINQLASELKLRDTQLAEHIAWANHEIDGLRQQLRQAGEAQRQLLHESTELQERLAGAEARVQALWSSASWRITAPVRFVLRRAPFLHRLVATPPRMVLRLLRGQPPRPTAPAASGAPAAATPPVSSLLPRAAPETQPQREFPALLPPSGPGLSFRLELLAGGAIAADALPRQPAGERVLCFTHVVPYPSRAGNEYRIHQMLRFLANQGRDVLLVVCPLPNEPFSDAQAEALAAAYPSLIICGHDGRIRHSAGLCQELLETLAGRTIRDIGSILNERDGGDPARARLIGLQRAFCPDPLVELLVHLEREFRPAVLLAEYVFMTRSFPLLRRGAIKIVDTIDAYSTKSRLVEQYGVTDGLSMSDEEEAELLGRADVAIAIQKREAEIFEQLAPGCEIITVGVDFPVRTAALRATAPILLLVASGNPMNVKGLRDFVQLCWPMIRRAVPEAKFHVVGPVGATAGFMPEGVRVLGRVDDLGAHYEMARVVVNPVVAGTGLKIKTVEGLAHLRPVVCWPAGADGLDGVALELCHVVEDWAAFARQVVHILQDDQAASEPANRRAELAACLAPDRVYAPLAALLDRTE